VPRLRLSRVRRRKPEAQRKASEAVHHYLAGLNSREIAEHAGYSNPGNAWCAVQRFLDDTPDPANSTHQRMVETIGSTRSDG
jgi:hypothetical protein